MQDLEKILDTVLPVDPSFRRIEPAMIDRCIYDTRRYALEGSKEAFLFSAMRLLALPDNGHTRLIPNDSISVLPLRFVSVGTAVQLTDTALETTVPRGELIAVNGTPLSQIEAAAGKFLAGTRQRKRCRYWDGRVSLNVPCRRQPIGTFANRRHSRNRQRAYDNRIR